MTAYYNEKDPFAAEWLCKLIAANMIAPGDVDERSIEDVIPVELAKYTQCHFFAGIGGWSYAMRLAGWPDDRHGWSGSCPCQPFSQAGQGAGFADERHLWPAFFHLIEQCRPGIVFGEQVASPDGLAWLDLVQSDMEGTDYAFGALDQCAAGFGARISGSGYTGWPTPCVVEPSTDPAKVWERKQRLTAKTGIYRGNDCGLGSKVQLAGWPTTTKANGEGSQIPKDASPTGRRQDGSKATVSLNMVAQLVGWPTTTVDDAKNSGRPETKRPAEQRPVFFTSSNNSFDGWCGPTNGHWRAADWLRCKDDKWRPVEPGAFPLAHGVPNRVGLLRGYGNAIVASQAQEFVKAAMQYAP